MMWSGLAACVRAGNRRRLRGQLFYIRNAEQYCTGQTNPATGRRYTAEDVAVARTNDHTFS
jgi:hypothetical protein